MKYEICECGKFAFLMDAESVASLPDGYVGELCPSCNLWMCAIDKLTNNACNRPAFGSKEMSQPYKVSVQENSDSLRQEAYTIIQRAFNIPQGFDDLSLNRLVDCIISAAVLQVSALQEKAAQPLRAIDGGGAGELEGDGE